MKLEMVIQFKQYLQELSKKNLEKLNNIKKTIRTTLTNDDLTNNTFDDLMSCQTFLHWMPPNETLDISDDHMCSYKRRYLIDQLKHALNQGQYVNMSLITRALQRHQDERRSEVGTALMTDDENVSVRGLKINAEKYLDRQMRIQRYKNKKRNWERKVSYQGRSQAAETRLRIKGRFLSKEDQNSINKLLNNKGGEAEYFDKKKNLDLEKFDKRTHLFQTDPKNLPKKQILSLIRDECQFQAEQKRVIKQIKNQSKVFTILRNE